MKFAYGDALDETEMKANGQKGREMCQFACGLCFVSLGCRCLAVG